MKNFNILVEKITGKDIEKAKERQIAITKNIADKLLPVLTNYFINKLNPILLELLDKVVWKPEVFVVTKSLPKSVDDFILTETTIKFTLVTNDIKFKNFKIVITFKNLVENEGEFMFNSFALTVPKLKEFDDGHIEFDSKLLPQLVDRVGVQRWKSQDVLKAIDDKIIKTKMK